MHQPMVPGMNPFSFQQSPAFNSFNPFTYQPQQSHGFNTGGMSSFGTPQPNLVQPVINPFQPPQQIIPQQNIVGFRNAQQGYQQPGYQQPGYQQTGFGQPGYQQTGFGQPAPFNPFNNNFRQ